jgi:type IV secretion system protein VirD4
MLSGAQPIRAKKARYYEDARFQERVLPPPAVTSHPPQPDDWSTLQPRTPSADLAAALKAEDAANGGLRREPELPDHVAIVKETTAPSRVADEFDLVDETPEQVARQAQVLRQRMRGVARQVSMDPGDDLGM